MKTIAFGTISIIAFAGLAMAGAPEGKALFTAKCSPCHGPNGEGKPAIAKMYGVTQRPLGSKDVQARPDAELKKVVLGGQGKMKPVSGVTEKEADDVVAFLRTLK